MKLLSKIDSIITRTLKTSMMFDAFWERWIAHGLQREELEPLRSSFRSIDNWTEGWLSAAKRQEASAEQLKLTQSWGEAECMYRTASLSYNLLHWIHPQCNAEKMKWYEESIRVMRLADSLSNVETRYVSITMENSICAGRIRIPAEPIGCIMIIVPIDSAKEELYTYEADFNQAGFVTVSFDGPGQGETYTFHGLRATKSRWEQFMDRFIHFTEIKFPNLPIYLFGTSLGASWALYGSCHPKIKATVAVSAAVEFEKMKPAGYFLDRTDCSCVPDERPIPAFSTLSYHSPVLMFHGTEDQLVSTSSMYELFNSLPVSKKLVEYEGEGHCCNNKLREIRQIAIQWFGENL